MIDLGVWNLTIPEGTPATIVSTAQLNKGYQSEYFRNDGSRVVLWAPVTGGTTRGSAYPRSELRETTSAGKNRNWRLGSGDHRLSASLAVEAVPSSGKVVIGQVHAANHSAPYLKIVYYYVREVGYVVVELRAKPGDAKTPVVMTYQSMPLGHDFSYDIQLTRSGQLNLRIDGLQHSQKIDTGWKKYDLYFKAGAYVIDNQGPHSEGGRVRFQQLQARHD